MVCLFAAIDFRHEEGTRRKDVDMHATDSTDEGSLNILYGKGHICCIVSDNRQRNKAQDCER